MTAIYAIWNNYGFSLASDSNQSATTGNQTWIDPVEKILMLQDHQIAIAGAGAAMLHGVEVNELFRSWEKTLPSEGFASIDNYFVDFVNWYSRQDFPSVSESFGEFEKEAMYWLEEIKEVIETEALDPKAIQDKYLDYACDSRRLLNLFSQSWSLLGDPSELLDEFWSFRYESFERINLLLEKSREKDSNFRSFSIVDHPRFEDELSPLLSEYFARVFNQELDDKNQSHVTIISLALMMMDNKCIFHSPVKFLMIGYGNSEWMPSGIVFEASHTFFGIPRLNLWDYSNSTINWYMAIAVDTAVTQLMHGQSSERANEIHDLAIKYFDNDSVQEFENELVQITNSKFHSSLARIDDLTLGRLEFVSRLFVQIEALKSFLDEPVPGVGGDIQVITMSKTTRKQKYYRELE
jgi:hypothetical protein